MPDLIRLLPDSVANQIAAGEVIQRPASVVKELMENAVDSGADTISVVIKDSGKTLIQVTDNGTGMSETDARLSFERHATSKITSANDLFAIKTKGFRGEALASIAAVAMVELKTRRGNDEAGTHIVISASKVEKQESCSSPEGSGFSVKNLFFNIPARRKFLKSDNTELRHIINEFQKVVLAHPGIKFTLNHDNTEVYNLPAGNLRQRIVGVFGRQINNDLIPVDTRTTLITINGFVGKPESARRTSGEQFFFVNDRFMKHPYFHKAVSEAYQNILPPDVIPSYFIYMEADPASIDINIHPTKTEIKFEDERAIWQILMASVREALGRFNIVPSIDFESGMLVDIPVRNNSDPLPQPPGVEIDHTFNPFGGEKGNYVRGFETERFSKPGSTGWEKLFHSHITDNEDDTTNKIPEQSGRLFFQLKGRYIACPVKSGLMLIDQKRAHERVLYDRFLSALENSLPAGQISLFPVLIEPGESDILVLRELSDVLAIIGFTIEFPDERSARVTSAPAGIEVSDVARLLETIVEDFKTKGTDPGQAARENMASAVASAAAIQYGRALAREEMEELFDRLFASSSPNLSPKGKPVLIILSMDEIDKRLS